MTDRDQTEDRKRTDALDVLSVADLGLTETDVVTDLGSDLRSWIEGTTPDPADIEAAFSRSLPDGTAIVDTEVLPDASLDGAEVDRVVETGGQAVELAVHESGDAGTVLVDTGGEVVELAIEGGGEAAAEATGEIIAAALEGV